MFFTHILNHILSLIRYRHVTCSCGKFVSSSNNQKSVANESLPPARSRWFASKLKEGNSSLEMQVSSVYLGILPGLSNNGKTLASVVDKRSKTRTLRELCFDCPPPGAPTNRLDPELSQFRNHSLSKEFNLSTLRGDTYRYFGSRVEIIFMVGRRWRHPMSMEVSSSPIINRKHCRQCFMGVLFCNGH